jgi:hypothetical protein
VRNIQICISKGGETFVQTKVRRDKTNYKTRENTPKNVGGQITITGADMLADNATLVFTRPAIFKHCPRRQSTFRSRTF